MKLIVLGASGGCGQWVVKLAHERGHDITAVVRPSSSYVAPEGVSVFREDIQEEGPLKRLLGGKDIVISCLGMSLSKSGSPFQPLQSPPDLMSSVAKLLCSVMPVCGLTRVISISSGGVGDSAVHTNLLLRCLFNRSNIAISHRDLARMEELYAESDLDWLAIRPVTLKEGPPTNTAKAVSFYRLMARITKGEVARLLVDAAEKTEPFSDHTPMYAG
ncbi:MAG: NAD(P)H-binding protein [Pseudomonadota bacterium]